MKILAAALLISVICMMVPAQIERDFQKQYQSFKETYLKELKDNGIAGSSFVMLKGDSVIANEIYGSQNLEKNLPVTRDTIYHWASNTKPFTGIAIMQLRDRGLLKLSDPVTKYLPELRKVHNPYGSMDDITIKQLMNHSAGFRNPTFPWKTGEDWEPFEPTEYSQLVATLPFTKILFPPGSRSSYSNPGIVFLGEIVEKLSGEDYEVYVEKNILRPLGMRNSYFDTTPEFLLKHRSHSYYIENGKMTPGRFDADTGITVSNSGLNSPMPDMTRYLRFLINVGSESELKTYGTILKRSSLEEMWQQTIASELDANGNPGVTTGVGLIYFIDERNGEKYLGHGGDQNGFISYLEFNSAKKTASLLVFNTNILYPTGTPPEQDMVMRLRKEVRRLHQSL